MAFVLVALVGAALLLATPHDGIGIGLLLVGDAMTIAVFALYLFADPD
jgi:hypothetical protein